MANIFSKNYQIKIYPAIDLKDGKCVRLYKGDMNKATIFNENPVNQAKIFEQEGFKFLHIVDLDGAIAGTSKNEEVIKNRTIHIEKWIKNCRSNTCRNTINSSYYNCNFCIFIT